MPTPKTQLIKSAIQNMDIEALKDLLNPAYRYDDASKEVFLAALADVFDEFKLYGNHFLVPHESTKNTQDCAFADFGIAFVGNHSKHYLRLVFNTEKDDYLSIKACDCFELDLGISKYKYFSLSYYSNAKLSDPAFWEIEKACFKAYKELTDRALQTIDERFYLPWLARNKTFFLAFGDIHDSFFSIKKYPKYTTKLVCIYRELDEQIKYLECIEPAKQALKDYSKIDSSDEQQLLAWLVKYEKVGMDLFYFFELDLSHIDTENPENNQPLEIKFLLIDIKVYLPNYAFAKIFYEFYFDLFDKYGLFSELEEDTTPLIREDGWVPLTSLPYFSSLNSDKKC